MVKSISNNWKNTLQKITICSPFIVHLIAYEHSVKTIKGQNLFFISDFCCFIEMERHSVSPGWSQTYFVVQAKFQFRTIFLPQFPEYRDYRREPPGLAESKSFLKNSIIGYRK